MTTTHRSARRQGIIAGAVTFFVAILPTAGILYSAASGAVGSVDKNGLLLLAIIVFGLISWGSGYLVYRAFNRDPNRRPGDVWSTWFGGFVFFVLSTWFTPFLILLIFLDSDSALTDQLPLVYTIWTGLHLAGAGVGLVFAHELLRSPGESEPATEAGAEPAPG